MYISAYIYMYIYCYTVQMNIYTASHGKSWDPSGSPLWPPPFGLLPGSDLPASAG